MNREDPKLTALQFNQYINDQDIDGLSSLMSDDHTFIDRANEVSRGKDKMTKGWIEFFKMFPDYRNTFTRVESKEDIVIILGHAYWSEKEPYDPVIWTAKIKDGLVNEWRVYKDNEDNRRKFNLI